MPPMAAAAGLASEPAANLDHSVETTLKRTGLIGLYENAQLAAFGTFVAAVCFWGFSYWHAPSWPVVLWGAIILVTQSGRMMLAVAFSRDTAGTTRDDIWRWRYRLALLAAAVAWGCAPILFLPPDDTAYASLMILVLLGVAVCGVSTIAADRVSVYLWFLPVLAPLPVVLLCRFSPFYAVLAGLTVVFASVSLRAMLAQNRLLSSALRAQHENAALVGRLHRQIELTAQASRDKSRFLASASHDLRQPLHALSFFGATLEQRMAGSVDQPLIHNMMRSIEALDKSFGAILDISKLDAGAVEAHARPFPVSDVFRRLQLSFSGQAEEVGLQLRFRAGGRVVTSDPQLLERILGNLVQNALRYSRPGGGVLVAARDRGGGVSLEVWDNGIGIRESELPNIFAEFYQVANPERDRIKGLGMGLAIVKRLTELLGHELTVRSRLGGGSVFRIWVESTIPHHIEQFATAPETVPGPLEESRMVLLIDDEESIRTSVAELLTEWRYEVIAVGTVAEAVAAAHAQRGRIDVVISDLRLRLGEDGLRSVEKLRAACGYAVPAVIVTGDTSPDQVLRVHESGHVVLYKPVQPRQLLNALRRLA